MTRSNVSQIVTRKPFKITRNHPQITRKHIRKMGPVTPPIPYSGVSQVSPKIWVLLLLPKLRVVSVVSWSSCKSATHPPANPFWGCRKYQPVTDNALGVLSSWWLWLDANFCVPLLRTFSGSDFRSPPFWEQLQGPNKSIAVLVTFCMTSFDSFLSSGLLKIED